MTNTRLSCLAMQSVVLVLALLSVPATAQESMGPKNIELDGAEIRVKRFEAAVEKAAGRPITPGSEAIEAMNQVKRLHEAYPEHPVVKDLFKRVQNCVRLSRGDVVTIMPEMLAYRERSKSASEALARSNVEAWEKLRAEATKPDASIPQPFPVSDPRKVMADEMRGRMVVLEEFLYPAHEFMNNGIGYVFVGSLTKGYYYVEASTPAFLGVYEAIKRYRRSVLSELPESWIVVGKISDPRLMMPKSDKEPIGKNHWGWVVEPTALYVPGLVLAVADPDAAGGGRFIGEEQLPSLLAKGYSVTNVPDTAEPAKVAEIMITAIKEKNFPLYLECIDPEKKTGEAAMSRLNYLWDDMQAKFAKEWVHGDVYQVGEIEVLQGGVVEGSLEDYFADEDTRRKAAVLPLIEEVEVKVRMLTERGQVDGSPKPIWLRRTEGKRWYVRYGYDL